MDQQTQNQQPAAPAPSPVVDVSGALANEKLTVVGHDDAIGLPLVQNAAGQVGTFDARQYAKAKTGQDIPANVKFQYNTAANPVQASPESVTSRLMLENFTDDKSKLAYLTQKYGEVIPDKNNGLVVNNNGVYQAYDPRFFNTYNPRELAEGFVEQLPRMVGPAAAAAAVVAIAGSPVGLLAIGGTALAAGLISGSVRTSLGRLMGTYKADPEEQAKDIGLEGLVNLAGSYIPLGAKAGWGVVSKAAQTIKNTASEGVQSAATSIFGKLTGAGESAMSTLIEDSPGVISTLKKNLADAGGDVKEGINLATQRAADTAKAWLDQGIKALPAQFKAGMVEAADQAEKGNFKANVSDIIASTKQEIEKLNLGKFADSVDEKTGRIVTDFRPLNEAEKTQLGVADPAPGAMEQIQRVTKLLGRYANDGELEGKQAFDRLANLNKELNQIKYGLPDATPEYQRAVNMTIGAFKNNLGQTFTDQGLGDAWIAANKPYIQYSQAIDQARDILNSKDGIYTFLDRIGGKAGKQKSAYSIAGAVNALTGDSGDALYDQMLLHQASSKFMKWEPQLGTIHASALGSGSATAVIAHHPGALAIAGADLAASSPRLVANGVNMATAPGRLADSAHDAVLPYLEKFQDLLRQASPAERKIMLENPAYISGSYKTVENAIMNIGQRTQSIMQGAQKQIGQINQQGNRAYPQGQQNGNGQ